MVFCTDMHDYPQTHPMQQPASRSGCVFTHSQVFTHTHPSCNSQLTAAGGIDPGKAAPALPPSQIPAARGARGGLCPRAPRYRTDGSSRLQRPRGRRRLCRRASAAQPLRSAGLSRRGGAALRAQPAPPLPGAALLPRRGGDPPARPPSCAAGRARSPRGRCV